MGPLAELGSKILVLNAGSSSLKFKLFDASTFAAGVGGLIERIGDTANSTMIAKQAQQNGTKKWNEKVPIPNHVAAMEQIMSFLNSNVSKNIGKDVLAVGHRVVHGLTIHKAVLLTDQVIGTIREAATLAPLHNPPGLSGIEAARKVFSSVPQVGVFDTAYHQTMPSSAFMYGLPYKYYEQYHVRRYGFHGTSHKYLVDTAATLLNKPVEQLNAITCHLGNGSSITAVKGGLSVDTSMGMTPLEGLVMGTRSGDIDPSIPLHLMKLTGMDSKAMDNTLNKQSGLQGVCGHNDLRSIIDLKAQGDERAALALDMFVYRIRKYIGAYSAALGGKVDALIFSAGIGENSSLIRGLICQEMQAMGIDLDGAKNDQMVGGQQGEISTGDSRMKVLVIPTDEELAIAQETLQVVETLRAGAKGAVPAAA